MDSLGVNYFIFSLPNPSSDFCSARLFLQTSGPNIFLIFPQILAADAAAADDVTCRTQSLCCAGRRLRQQSSSCLLAGLAGALSPASARPAGCSPAAALQPGADPPSLPLSLSLFASLCPGSFARSSGSFSSLGAARGLDGRGSGALFGCWMAHCADSLDPVPSSFPSSLCPPVSLCPSVSQLVYSHSKKKKKHK